MNRIETKILNCFAVKEAEKNMVFAARLTQRGHIIHSMNDLVDLLQFAPSGGRKCVFQRPLCGAERPLVFS